MNLRPNPVIFILNPYSDRFGRGHEVWEAIILFMPFPMAPFLDSIPNIGCRFLRGSEHVFDWPEWQQGHRIELLPLSELGHLPNISQQQIGIFNTLKRDFESLRQRFF